MELLVLLMMGMDLCMSHRADEDERQFLPMLAGDHNVEREGGIYSARLMPCFQVFAVLYHQFSFVGH